MYGMIVIATLLSGLLVLGGTGFAGDKAARAKFGASPHTDNGDCTICHAYPAETLRGWFVLGSTKRKMKGGPTEVCLKCHGSGFGHATGKKTAVNHSDLPLDENGEITCAITCHEMHVRPEDQKQKYYHLRMPFDSLCISCHDK